MQQIDIKTILESIGEQGSTPPVHLWNPELSGEIDIVIQYDGSWLHEGSPIERLQLVKLFSSILKREDDDYFLVTPVEKWQIKVNDMPFYIPAITVSSSESNGSTVIQAITNTEEVITISADNPLQVELDETGQPRPQVLVRDGLWARLSRSAFYQLVELGVEEAIEEDHDQGKELVVYSAGIGFSLGEL